MWRPIISESACPHRRSGVQQHDAYLPVLNCRCFDPSEGNVLVEASLGIGIVAVAALIVGVVVVVLIVDRRNLKKALAAAATASPRRGKSEHLEMIREESQEEEDA